MRLAILGPLVVEDGATAREVAGGRLQALLTRLALDPGRAVSPGALAAAVWDGDPPRDEQHALQSLVSRLRRALGDPLLVTQEPGGYRLAVAPEDVDAVRFERLAREGAAALRGGEAATAARRLDEALALWRGAPAADAPRLTELHAAARVDRLAAAAALGDAAAHLAEIAELARGAPARRAARGAAPARARRRRPPGGGARRLRGAAPRARRGARRDALGRAPGGAPRRAPRGRAGRPPRRRRPRAATSPRRARASSAATPSSSAPGSCSPATGS